jgi:arylsulfatase A
MTGLHSGHCTIRGNREVEPEGQVPLPDRAVTIAELLRAAGYHAGAFGKWGLGFPGSIGDPTNQGFEEYYGYNCQRSAHRYFPDHLWHNQQRVPLDGETYADELIMEHALDFIRAHHKDPFFCYLATTLPHAALEIPEKHKSRFRQQFAAYEDETGKYAGATYTNPKAAFAAMVTRLDDNVGRITSLLKELGIERNTLIVFTSDNGPHQEGGHEPAFFHSAGPLRGLKRDLYEGGIRVPTIVSWPGSIRAGETSDHASAAWDWLATLSELAGIDPQKLPEHDGISLVPLLLDQPNQRAHESLYWEFHEQGGRQAIRADDWKAIRLNVNKTPDGSLELYNLADDPGETTNLAAQHPDLVQKLSNLMAQSHTPSKLFPFAQQHR